MQNALVIYHAPGVHMDQIGLIPTFLDPNDPRPCREQIDGNYQHGGGWRPLKGYTMRFDAGHKWTLQYPDEPDLKPLAMIRVNQEMVIIYPYGITAILQKDRTFEVARLD